MWTNVPLCARHSPLGATAPFGEPRDQIVRQVPPERYLRALAVLFVGSVKHSMRMTSVEVQLAKGQRRQFTLSQPGQNQRLVNQRPFPSQIIQSLNKARLLYEPYTRSLKCLV